MSKISKKERAEVNAFLEPLMEEIRILDNRRKWQIEKYGKINQSLEKKLENLKARILDAKAYQEKQKVKM